MGRQHRPWRRECTVATAAMVLLANFMMNDVVQAMDDSSAKINDPIAGYEPTSVVTGVAALDLDQVELEDQLGHMHFGRAKTLYKHGGHASPLARLSLHNMSSADYTRIRPGMVVLGAADSEMGVRGEIIRLENWKHKEKDESPRIIVRYNTTGNQASYVNCQVGGLIEISAANRQGCFASKGTVQLVYPAGGKGDVPHTYEYSYDTRHDNFNELTLRSTSTNAQSMIDDCFTCSFQDFERFLLYYGSFDYADRWVMSAMEGGITKLDAGNANFVGYDKENRAVALQLGTKVLNLWMFVVMKMEQAIGRCELRCHSDCTQPVEPWDEAVAAYAGSLRSGTDSGEGVFLYDLADAMCKLFRTCGDGGDMPVGMSSANQQILDAFTQAKQQLDARRCQDARATKHKIVDLMKVPLIQGTLQVAYLKYYFPAADAEGNANDQVRGATFVASLLPFVASCDPTAGTLLEENMGLNEARDSSFDFRTVKYALERTYSCMGVSCDDVGGLWQHGEYKAHARPCVDSMLTEDGSGKKRMGIASSGTTMVYVFSAVIGIVAVIYAFRGKPATKRSTTVGNYHDCDESDDHNDDDGDGGSCQSGSEFEEDEHKMDVTEANLHFELQGFQDEFEA